MVNTSCCKLHLPWDVFLKAKPVTSKTYCSTEIGILMKLCFPFVPLKKEIKKLNII